VSRAVLAALLLAGALAGALACGKYGPPVRAGEAKPPAKKSFEIPLPGSTEPGPGPGAGQPEPATPEASPPVEEEPPPEGAP
jgi:hypothetical protein